jgi:hypothetical protein
MSDTLYWIAGAFLMFVGLAVGSMCLFAMKCSGEGVEVTKSESGRTRMPMGCFAILLFLLFVGCFAGGLYLTLKGFHAVE